MSCSGATCCDTDLTNEDVDKIKEQWRKYYKTLEEKSDNEMKCDYKNTNEWQCLVCFITNNECYPINLIKLFHNWDKVQKERE